MPLNLTDFNQILNIAQSGHVETIQNVIKDTSPSQEHPNHHQLQPKIYKCHQSLRGFLMPSNSSDFNQILNIAPSGHMQTSHVHGPSWASQRLNWDWGKKKNFHQRLVETGPGVKKISNLYWDWGQNFFLT